VRVAVSGVIGQYPLAGVTLCYLQYLLGLSQLGHEAFYIEDNGACPYNPDTGAVDLDYSYSVPYLERVMDRYGLSHRWSYMTCAGDYFGLPGAAVHEILRTADLYLNLSGATVLRDEHLACPVRAFVDTDPAFLQFGVASRKRETIDFLAAHTFHFTYAENIGKPRCTIPTDRFRWQPTRQPLVLDVWKPDHRPPGTRFTTVTNWNPYGRVRFRGETYGHKDVEFNRFLELPRLTSQELELAIAARPRVRAKLQRHGWRVLDARLPTKDIPTFQRYIAGSRAEFSLAKNAYVKTQSGWFSERDLNYLASGRPVLAQDTGFSEFLPTGEGLLAFQTMEEAVEGIDEINRRYEWHCRAARRFAEEHFDARDVLTALLQRCGLLN